MTDADVAVTKLRIEVSSEQVEKASDNLDDLTESGSEASAAAASLRSSWIPTITVITAAATAAALLAKRLYDGSVAASDHKAKITALVREEAAVATQFERLIFLSGDLKDGLDEATDAYVFLRARGLNPTNDAIKAYASTAAHYGESTMAMLEAVEKATRGKFDALSKFGIEMVQEGDKIRATTQGITSTIDATTHSVQNYLIELGETRFSNTLEDQGKSITATLADMAAEIDKTFVIIAHHTGTDNMLEEFFSSALDSVREFNQYLVAGGLERDIYLFVARVQGALEDLVEEAQIRAAAFVDAWLIELSYLSERGSAAVESLMGVFSGEDTPTGDDPLVELAKRRQTDLELLEKETEDSVSRIKDHREAMNRALMLLPPLGEPPPSGDSADGTLPDSVIESKAKPKRSARPAVDTSQRELEALERSLQTQEERIGASYFRRLEIIRKYTEDGSDEQYDLTTRLVEQTQLELLAMSQMRTDDMAGYIAQLHDAEVLLAASFEERRRIILDNTRMTEDQRLSLMTQAEADYTARQRQLEVQRQRVTLKLAGDFFGNISMIAAAFGSKGAKIAKAAAIVQTTIKMYESATSAYAAMAGIPYVGPALGVAAAGAAIAAGAANIAAIKSQNYVGAFADGGHIPYGSVGMIAEAGPEIVRGPMDVTSARQTREILGSSGTNVTVQVFNLPGQTAIVEKKEASNGGTQLRIIIAAVENQIASSIRTGNGLVTSALQETFSLARA